LAGNCRANGGSIDLDFSDNALYASSYRRWRSTEEEAMQANRWWRDALVVAGIVALVVASGYLSDVVESVGRLEHRLTFREPSLEKLPATSIATGDGQQKYYTYVPAYSHIYSGGGNPLLLEITLSIRNPDPRVPLQIHTVSYYDSNGGLLQAYLQKPAAIAPMATASYLSPQQEKEGGSGANFVVVWSSEREDAKPIIETVMIGAGSGKQVSFTSRGETLPYPFHQ
jgi:hypothetical protein